MANLNVSLVTCLRKCFKQLPGYLRTNIRSYVHTVRYQGYVSKFPANSANQNIGFAVRNDEPDKEYVFNVYDVLSEDIQCVRKNQPIEFKIYDGKPYSKAKDITAPSRRLIKYNRDNLLKQKVSQWNQRLSKLSNTPNTRYTGTVYAINPESNTGFIVPDRINCDLVYFDPSEIQCTGIPQLHVNEEVEFYAIDQHQKGNDVALFITRPGGGLITVEDYDLGSYRRTIGEIYKYDDKVANISSEYNQERHRGYIIHCHKDRLIGYISLCDPDNNELVSIHVDDCHMFGNRKLRRFQEVEFCLMPNTAKNDLRCLFKAIEVTGPGLSILHYNKRNYLPNGIVRKNKKFKMNKKNNEKRYQGIIGNINYSEESHLSNKYEIYPKLYGYKSIYMDSSDIRAVGSKGLKIGDAVEFHIDYETQKPYHVTAEGGEPFICEHSNSAYSRYIRSKKKLSTMRSDFMIFSGSHANGFIAGFNEHNQCGTIEIIAPQNIRYKQIVFHSNEIQWNKKKVKKPNAFAHKRISFDIVDMNGINGSNNPEFFSFNFRKDLDLTKKAVNIKINPKGINNYNETTPNVTEIHKTNPKDNTLTQINKIMHTKLSYLRY